jgi:hypothetical protein
MIRILLDFLSIPIFLCHPICPLIPLNHIPSDTSQENVSRDIVRADSYYLRSTFLQRLF